CLTVLPPFIGGLHCGIKDFCSGFIEDRRVLPPFIGGLHCGHLTSTSRSAGRARAPAVHRRAPLRQVPVDPGRGGVLGAPAVHRRAPLRLTTPPPRRTRRQLCSRRSSLFMNTPFAELAETLLEQRGNDQPLHHR